MTPDFAWLQLPARVIPIERTLELGEVMRRALLAASGRGCDPPRAFLGRDRAKTALDHEHASYLPWDEDGDGWLDGIAVWVPAGLDPVPEALLWSLESLWSARLGRRPVRLAFVGARAQASDLVPGLVGPARRWVSGAPFVLPRHPKRARDGRPRCDDRGRWRDGPCAQLEQELSGRGLPAPQRVVFMDRTGVVCPEIEATGSPRWHARAIQRAHGGGARSGLACWSALEFEEPAWGPIALGYASHYGLGVFRAAACTASQPLDRARSGSPVA